jgi:hypothetical protein
MRRLLAALLVAMALTVGLAASVAAHTLVVTNPRTGDEQTSQGIGGGTVPADADPMFGPNNVPPAHGKGLVNACEATENNAVVAMPAPAPPSHTTTCEHGGAPE